MVGPSRAARWPDFFLVGAPRCGTTSMYTLLKQHPGIDVAVHKEPYFFGSDLTVQPHTMRDEATYLSLFGRAAPEQRVGEGSVWYLRSARAADEIAARCPDARIVIMLRDPVEMVRSLHGLYLRTGNEDLPSLAAALDAEEARRAGRRLPPLCYFPEGLLYTEVARYRPQVERYLHVFGPERVKVVLFDDYVADGAGTYRAVLDFLGVDAAFEPDFDLEAARRAMRPQILRQLRTLRARSPKLIEIMRDRGRNHIGGKPPIEPGVQARLVAAFADDIAATAALIGRDLSRWARPAVKAR